MAAPGRVADRSPGGRRRPEPGSPPLTLVLRRLAWLAPILVFVIVVTFVLVHAAPGSPWNASGSSTAYGQGLPLSAATIRNLNEKYGLDRPLPTQLLLYLRDVTHFDFGVSYQYQGEQVRTLILRSWPETLALGTAAFVVITVVGLGLGVLAALRRGSATDYAVTGFSAASAAVPNYVVGIFLVAALSVGLRNLTGGAAYLPPGGFGLDQHLVLPVITLSLLPVAFLARLTRSTTLDVLRQDHVRTAEAKGLRRAAILLRHVVRNSLIVIVTALGPIFAFLVTGSVVVETVFQIHGIGGLFVASVQARDYPVILGTTITYCILIVVVNLVVDLLYTYLDPRVRPA